MTAPPNIEAFRRRVSATNGAKLQDDATAFPRQVEIKAEALMTTVDATGGDAFIDPSLLLTQTTPHTSESAAQHHLLQQHQHRLHPPPPPPPPRSSQGQQSVVPGSASSGPSNSLMGAFQRTRGADSTRKLPVADSNDGGNNGTAAQIFGLSSSVPSSAASSSSSSTAPTVLFASSATSAINSNVKNNDVSNRISDMKAKSALSLQIPRVSKSESSLSQYSQSNSFAQTQGIHDLKAEFHRQIGKNKMIGFYSVSAHIAI